MNSYFWFPYEKLRKGQYEMMNSIREALLNSKPILIHAPTGIGKTSAVLASVLPFAKETQKKVFFLTSRLLHHHLIKETIREIIKKHSVNIKSAYLIGKRYLCSYDFAVKKNDFHEFCAKLREHDQCPYYLKTYQNSKINPEIISQIKEYDIVDSSMILDLFRENFCSYEISIYLAKNADIIVLDYNYILNPTIRNIFLKRFNLSLDDCIFIFDESHNLPKRATEILSSKITIQQIKNTLMQLREFNYEIDELNFLYSFLEEKFRDLIIKNLLLYNKKFVHEDVVRFKKDLENKSIGTLRSMFERILIEETEIVDQISFSREELSGVSDLLDLLYSKLSNIGYEIIEHVKKNYVLSLAKNLETFLYLDPSYFTYFSYSRDSQNFGIYAECLDPSKLFLDLGNNIIAMSGTLKPVEMYNQILFNGRGIEKTFDSPFPEKNKLEIILTDVSSLYKKRNEEEYKRIASKLTSILNYIPGNVLIYFPSYYFLYSIKRYVNTQKAILVENPNLSKREKDDLLDEFKGYAKRSHPGGVLFAVSTGNFAEGIDLPDEYLNAVIIVGFPLEKPDLRTRARIEFYDKKFGNGENYAYIYPTLAKVMQNAGRCIRTEKDRGIIIYMDERFKRFKSFFPSAIIDPKDIDKIIQDFFRYDS
ncbi:MAG: ATP-dependent DNA helicase [Candidatus Woesearchaeota archaeon]